MLATMVLAASLVAEPARSAEVGEISLRLPVCERPPFDYEQLVDILNLELAPEEVVMAVPTAPSRGGTEIDIAVPCRDHVDHVSIDVRTPDFHDVSRRMEIGDLPRSHRPRGIAVVTAELVRSVKTPTSEARRVDEEAPRDRPDPEMDRPPSLSAPSVRDLPQGRRGISGRPFLSFEIGAETRVFMQAPTATLGGTLGGQLGRGRTNLHFLHGESEEDGARTLAAVTFGFDVWRFEPRSFELAMGPRIGGGMVIARRDGKSSITREAEGGSFDGAAPDAVPRAVRTPHFEAALECDLRWRFTRTSWLTAGVDVGYVYGLIDTVTDGALTELRLGIAFAP